MRRSRWIAIAAAAAVAVVAVIVILAFTLHRGEPERTAVVVEEGRPAAPARPAERGAGEQPAGGQQTTTQPAAPQPGTPPAGPTGKQAQPPSAPTQGAPPSNQTKPPQAKPTAALTVQQQLDAITGGRNTTPAMVEFGADWCPPCKKMKPIVQDLEKQYGDKVDIVYVDVDKYPDIAQKYNISAIPVQVFYDKQGKQLDRHEGFYSKDEIVSQFKQMGVTKT